jgi:hypothetical protein
MAKPGGSSTRARPLVAAGLSFLKANRALFKIGRLERELQHARSEADRGGMTHLRYRRAAWQHGVTDVTASLDPACEPGTLDESWSDVFAAMIDRDDWLIGEEFRNGCVRPRTNPTKLTAHSQDSTPGNA